MLWQPEGHFGCVSGSSHSIPRILVEKEKDTQKQKEQKLIKSELLASDGDGVAKVSLFDRLLSMLVEEEDSDDGNEDENTKFDNDMIIDEVYHDETDAGCMLDVSDLSLDQRAYIHLRSIHLIDQPFLPTSRPNVIELDMDHINASRPVHDANNLDAQLLQMQYNLSKQHKYIYTTAALLKHKAEEELDNISHQTKMKEEETSIISKHSQMLQKVSKKKEDVVKDDRKQVESIHTGTSKEENVASFVLDENQNHHLNQVS